MVRFRLVGSSAAGRVAGLAAAAFALLLAVPVFAQVDIDNTCASCSRRKNDSLNLQIRKIRLNQVGYLPQDPNKAAMVADPASQSFSIVELPSRRAVFTGTLQSVGNHTEGEMLIKSYYNSITVLDSMYRPPASVHLHRANFSALQAPGTYVMACGRDTSATFQIDPKIYNFVFETSLKFFGVNRCGNTHSWIHAACHLKDGDALGADYAGKLSGGWHDCGDHGKYSATLMYAALTLSMTYAFWPEKAEDFYGASYHDTLPFGTDGIPDVLYEAKVGADYIMALYRASKAKGIFAQGDMYHSVGNGPGMDHLTWDVPERQDALPQNRGGPARPVTAGIGANTAGVFAATLAFFAWGWEPFDPALAAECLAAAKDIYDKMVLPKRRVKHATTMPCCYTGGASSKDDDEVALAAFALWFVTKENRFRYDLIENPALGQGTTSQFNQGEFPFGIMAVVPFYHGGWTTDYENYYAFVLYGMVKLILNKPATLASYGLTQVVADSLKQDCITALYRSVNDGSNGNTRVSPGINADHPYHGVFTSVDWGFNRYNLGLVQELFMYWDLTGQQDYYNIGIDNLNYNLGMNPWDLSFIMGAGEKNLQHPHNRAANPEGLNTGGFPYPYRSPKGALMGGCKPGKKLMDYWQDYTVTETCIDFSAQLLIPTQMLAQDLPPDTSGPKFRNVNVFPEVTTALVTWSTDEISRDTLVLLDAPGGRVLQVLPAEGLVRNKQVNILGLTPATTYYFYFKGMDVRRNHTEDRNNGEYWKFTTKSTTVAALITNVKVCNETHESAMVTWWTRNGQYDSRVDYGKTTALGLTKSPDDAGIPTMFHQVTLTNLDAATLYYFQVWSGTVKDDNAGRFHTFTTSQVLVDYTVRIKPTNKAASGQSAHFYIDVANNEDLPYVGLELRFYFTSDATTAAGLVARGFDNQIFGVSGIPRTTTITYGAARQVPNMPTQWYFPITINDTLPVSGRARFELQINSGGPDGWNNQPFAYFNQAWSIRPHTQPPDPVPFEGVDLTKGSTGVYRGPEMVEVVDGKNIVAYVENPYITAYYKGVHVFGYGPDYLTDVLEVRRQASLALTQPVASPVDRLDLQQEDGSITLAGRASSDPEGRIDEIVINGETLPESSLQRATTGAVTFTRPTTLVEGTNVFDIIAWDTAHCAFASRKLIVNWRKAPPLPPPPPPQVAKPVANPPGQAGRDSIVVGLTTATPGATIWYTLNGSLPSPGAAGSIQYTGTITLKDQTTLTAIAVKPEYTPSDTLVENYEVFPFKVTNVRPGVLLDRDADGYADMAVFILDTTLGAPALDVVTEQMKGAKLTGGLAIAGFQLSVDTLRINLAANTLLIEDGKESLTLPPPAAVRDGMLRPGDFSLRDGVAPVLRRAVLLRGTPGQPDTLVTTFSEPPRPETLGPRPFLVIRPSDSLRYAFVLGAGVKTDLPSLRPGETAYRFPVQSLPTAADPAVAAAPQAGDWIWIDPAAGLADLAGNAQGNPANVRVPLLIRVPLAHVVLPVAPDGISRMGTTPTAPFSVYGGPQVLGTVGEGAASLPALPVRPDPSRYGGISIESTLPFAVTLRVHTTLGQFVNKVTFKLTDRDFALLEPGTTPGSKRLLLLWNGASSRGHQAGTGAYVYLWNLTFFPADGPPKGSTGKGTFGVLRDL